MSARVVVFSCLFCAGFAGRVRAPQFEKQADSQAQARVLAKLLQASKPASGFSASGALTSAPANQNILTKRGRGMYMQAPDPTKESWKDYLTRAVATLEKIEADKKAEEAIEDPEPIKPLKVFDSSDYKEAAQKYKDYMAKSVAAEERSVQLQKLIEEYAEKLEEEVAKIEVLKKSINVKYVPTPKLTDDEEDWAAAQASYNKLMTRADQAEAVVMDMDREGADLDQAEIEDFRVKLGETFQAFAKSKQYFPEMNKFFDAEPDDSKIDYETPGVNVAPIYGYNAEGKIVAKKPGSQG
mmetsp:Transcript_63212/g.115410  ORF Transcript_63212/g.115410 Transcript_63212/m.115410 type:complete len:297 (-) Transcript_63212:186-1076(-)